MPDGQPQARERTASARQSATSRLRLPVFDAGLSDKRSHDTNITASAVV